MADVTMICGIERLKEESATLYPPDAAGGFFGQLEDHSTDELLKYHGACERGELVAMIDGKGYRITELRSNGEFRAIPK